MIIKNNFVFLFLLLLSFIKPVLSQDNQVTKEKLAALAREQFDRGTMIVENAQTNEDFKKAITEFKNSLDNSMYGGIYTELRSSIYYNLGLLYEKIEDYDMADYYLTFYISCDPLPPDVEEVKDLIKQVQAKSAVLYDPQSLTGIWYYSVPRASSEPRLELRFNFNTSTLEARCLTSEASDGQIPAGDFVKAEWDIFKKKLTITDAPYNTCDKSVDPNWCPHKVALHLIRTGKNKLEGELSDTGIIYQDMNNPEIFSSSGKVVFERYEEK